MSWLEEQRLKRLKKEDERAKKRWEKEEKEYEITEAKLKNIKREKERQMQKKELRERQKEIRQLKHPYQESTRGSLKRAGSRALGFGGELAREGVRSYRTFNRRIRSKKPSRRTMRSPQLRTTSQSFTSPGGEDLSLAGGITRNDWMGTRNIMNTDFFGTGEQRELLEKKEPIEFMSNKKKPKQYY